VSYPFNIRNTAQASALTALATVDCSPSIQSVPTTLAGANTLAGKVLHEWFVGNMASGNLVGVNGITLTASGSPRYSCTWPGWDGTDYTSSYRAVEFNGSTAAFTASSTAFFDFNRPLTFVSCIRMLRATGVAQGLYAKKASFAAGSAGYGVYFGATGDIGAIVSNGTDQINVNTAGTTNELDKVVNGAPQWVAFKLGSTAAQLLAYREAGTAVTLPGGTYTNATAWTLGYLGWLNSATNCQLLCLGVLVGDEAEDFDIDDLNDMDDWMRAPTSTTYVRYSPVAPIVGSDATGVRVQHCAGSLVTTDLVHCAHAYAAASTAEGSVGVLMERGVESVSSYACRNRLLDTDDLSSANWTKSNVTATANQGEDPAGFMGAASLTATSNSGYVRQNFTGEASEDHTVSVFAMRNGASNVAARLSLYNSGAGTEISGTNITITSTWQRFSLTVPAATVGAVATLQWRLTVTTSGDSIFATFAQAEYGWLRQYQPQRGALLDRDQTEWTIDNSAGAAFDVNGGRIEVTCTGLHASVNSSGSFIFDTACGASFEDRILMQRDALTATYPADTQHYDINGTLKAQLSDLPAVTETDEFVYAYEWDASAPITGTTRAKAEVDSTTVTTGAVVPSSAWSHGTNATRLFIASRHSYSAHLEGVVTSVRTWGRS
jgi:hypothetical protein